jgi:hypothetical protein
MEVWGRERNAKEGRGEIKREGEKKKVIVG